MEAELEDVRDVNWVSYTLPMWQEQTLSLTEWNTKTARLIDLEGH